MMKMLVSYTGYWKDKNRPEYPPVLKEGVWERDRKVYEIGVNQDGMLVIDYTDEDGPHAGFAIRPSELYLILKKLCAGEEIQPE